MSSVQVWASPDSAIVVNWNKDGPFTVTVYARPGYPEQTTKHVNKRAAIAAARRKFRSLPENTQTLTSPDKKEATNV